MVKLENLTSTEFRNRLTGIILDTLACLPETHRNIFVWNHYRGWSVRQIGEMLDWRPSEVEAALDAMSLTLYQRIRLFFREDLHGLSALQSTQSGTAEQSKLRISSPTVGSGHQSCWIGGNELQ